MFLLGIAYGPRLADRDHSALHRPGSAWACRCSPAPRSAASACPTSWGPTGGYILSWLAAAAITGWVAQRSRHWFAIALGVLAAIVVNYTLGVAWLTTFVGWPKAFTVGVLPFLLGDLLKLALVTALAEAGISRLRQHLAD